MKIGVIGGGISGLAVGCKLSLLKKSGADIDITLIEAGDKLGGTIDTARRDGYVVEAGTNGFLDSKPTTSELFEEMGLSHKLVKSNDKARKRFIQRYGELQRLPEGGPAFLTSKILTMGGKLRLAGEMFVPKRTDGVDETLAEFIKRRLGQEALDYMIAPMVSGIFAGDPAKMSIRSCFPVISDLEKNYGGLIKGLLKKPKKKSGPAGPGGVLTSYEGGMGQAILDLEEKAVENGLKVIKSSPVKKITKKDNKYIVEANETHEFDIVAICAPSYEVAEFTKELDSELSEALSGIEYSPMFVCGAAFKSEDVGDELDGFGYLIPRKEGLEILGTLFTSSMFPMQAPSGTKLLRIMVGGDTNRGIENKSDDELAEICLNDVRKILDIKSEPIMVQNYRYSKAIPQYYVGHSERVAKVEERTKTLGNIYVGGNILYGIGLNDCTKTSKQIVENIRQTINA